MVDRVLHQRIAEMARQHVRGGDVSGWFEKLYELADGDMQQLPWPAGAPNPSLVRWLSEQTIEPVPGVVAAEGVARHPEEPDCGSAVVIGCGLGDDAEVLAAAGYDVVAFDVAETCVDWCKKRFPDSRVRYQTADLFALPAPWVGSFDLVYDCDTVQSLPLKVRQEALDKLVSLAAPGGRLLLISFARADGDVPEGPPWPLSRQELEYLEDSGLRLNRFEDFTHTDEQLIRRFVAEYQLPGAGWGPAPPSLSHWHSD